jgi:hypothetical protein
VVPEAGVEGGCDHLSGASAGAPDDGHGAERGRDAEETERDGVDEGLDVGVGRFGVVEGNVGARVGEGEEVVLERDEVEVLIREAGDAVGRAGGGGGGGEAVEERARECGGEVEVEGCVERGGGVCGDAVGVGLGGTEEVDGGGVGDLLARLVDGEVEGDAVLAEVSDAEQRREQREAEGVQHQDLVHLLFLLRGRAGRRRRLVEVQHPQDQI